jgi:hypothetical protein
VDGDRWMQTRVMDEVVRDRVCDRYPPQQKYIYRLLKRYMEGKAAMALALKRNRGGAGE